MNMKSDKSHAIASMLRAGKRQQEICEVLRCSYNTIAMVRKHYAIPSMPTGIRTTPDLLPSNSPLTATWNGVCYSCDLPCGAGHRPGDAQNRAIKLPNGMPVVVCESCSVAYRIFDCTTEHGRKKIRAFVELWHFHMEPSIESAEAVLPEGGYVTREFVRHDVMYRESAPTRFFVMVEGKEIVIGVDSIQH